MSLETWDFYVTIFFNASEPKMASKANSTDALLSEIAGRNFLQEHPASLFGHLPTL
jgi:hypothetical protein